jgi:hypothetical protein
MVLDLMSLAPRSAVNQMSDLDEVTKIHLSNGKKILPPLWDFYETK